MTARYSASVEFVFGVGFAAWAAATKAAASGPARAAMLRVRNINDTSEGPSRVCGNGAHFAGFQGVSHGRFVGRKSKARPHRPGRAESFARIVYNGAVSFMR